MTRIATSPHHRYLLSRLQREWDRLAVDPSAVRVARSWAGFDGFEPTDLDDFLSASGLGVRGHTEQQSSVLRRLVQLAEHEHLAARIVLQRLLPGLSALARRHSDTFEQGIDALDELVGVAWGVIRSFDLDRNRGYLVVSLLRSCSYHAFEAGQRPVDTNTANDDEMYEFWGCAVDDHAAAVDEVGAPDLDALTDPALEVAVILQEARRCGIGEDDLTLIVGLMNRPSRAVAKERRVTTRTLRVHRDQVVHRLRAVLAA